MKTVNISDITLREIGRSRANALSFKERVEIARTLDRLQVDAVELPAIKDGKADVLSNKTIASVVSYARLTAAAGLTEDEVDQAWESIKGASRPALHILLPASPVQMEYVCHKKAPAMLELVKALVGRARYHTERVEFSAVDATRAEPAVLYAFLSAAVEAGAGTVTLCDSAGIMTPAECGDFIRDVLEKVPALSKVRLGVELNDGLKMAAACAAAAVDAGAELVKTAITPLDVPTTEDFAAYMAARGEGKGLRCGLRTTELGRAAVQLQWLLQTERSSGSPFDSGVSDGAPAVCLTGGDDIAEVVKVVRHLGYDLSEEDNAKVYEAFQRIAAQKHFVSTRELDAIIASTAMQVPSVYRIVNYVITCGNNTAAMASLTLEKDGEKQTGVCMGDGPIDAAFLAIEQIIGHHYELADYQIQTVTEGREAMGSALVKLRSDGKLYSGNGISTDVIGSSIRAYISALNKIVYEQA
jgi:2-isopropylmalate synthase